MIRLFTPLLASIVCATLTHGAEITIEARPFTVEKSVSAAALPTANCVLLQLEPKSWQDFKIVEIADHGAKVAKGDVLVRFDAELIDRKLEDARRSLASGALNLAQAELDLKNLELTAPHRLEAFRRAAEIAKEENTYFTKVRRKASEEEAEQSLERRKQYLENQQEELKQLSQMYAADDLTEETEEIILDRQKNAVIAAEFSLRMGELEHQRTLEVALPREAVKLAEYERDSAIAQEKAEQDIPRSIKLKKLELETLRTSHEREKQSLADLELDRKLFEFTAPADGFFYHGAIENGRWVAGEAAKALVKHGKPALNRGFATFVPSEAPLGLTAFLDEATARNLKTGLTGSASPTGREDLDIPVTLAALAATPGPDGLYRADFTATWPAASLPAAGSTAQIRLIAYHQPAAVFVPAKALSFGVDGWTTEVKLADGKTERRPVKRGRASGENIEILSGLEVGQVVIAPGDK
jgi:multidrug resistance efflux pump